MRKMLKSCIGVSALLLAAFIAPAHAFECGNGICDPGCDIGCGKVSSLWYYGGHMEAGLYANSHGQRNVYDCNGNWPVNGWNTGSGNSALLGTARLADIQMNQLYGYFGKKLNTRCGWDIGGRVDFMYGTDAFYTQSRGFEYGAGHGHWGSGDYLSSIPQLYGEIGYRNVSVKLGKFYTPFGHEGIMSTERFFYSTGYGFNILPDTQTGALATWAINPCLSVYGGWTNGEDVIESYSFDTSDNNAALFGFNYKLGRKAHIGYGVLMGENKKSSAIVALPIPGGATKNEYFVHAFNFGYKLNRCWDYNFEWTLRNNNAEPGHTHVAAYGIGQELIYKMNRCWAFGLRGDWMYENTLNDANFYGLTLGANWTPNKWLLVRPEVRYDYCDVNGGYFTTSAVAKKDQIGAGVSTIVKF